MSKKGQVTVFIIIGIIMLFLFAGLLFVVKSVTKEKFNSGRDKNLLKDSKWRSIESFYLEAIK